MDELMHIREVKSNLLGYCKTFGFCSKKDWWGMNRLHLASTVDPSNTTMRFVISLFVRSAISTFDFQKVPAHEAVGVDVSHDDILQNFNGKDDVAMNGAKPWHGPREKAQSFMQMMVEAMTLPGDVVMDYTTGTCKGKK